MKVTSEDLKSLKQENTARHPDRRATCLPADTLARTACGELADEEREFVADHLGGCAECASEYRLVSAHKTWTDQTGQPSLSTTRPTLWSSVSRGFSHGLTPLAIVACLLVATMAGLSVWLIITRIESNKQIVLLNGRLVERERDLTIAENSLDEMRRLRDEAIRARDQGPVISNSKQTTEEVTKPQLGTPTFDLEAIRGGPAAAPQHIEIPKPADAITLIVNLSYHKQYSAYEVEVFDQHDNRVWLGKCKNPGDKLNLTLPRRYITGGAYLIKLYGLQNNNKVPLADLPITLTFY